MSTGKAIDEYARTFVTECGTKRLENELRPMRGFMILAALHLGIANITEKDTWHNLNIPVYLKPPYAAHAISYILPTPPTTTLTSSRKGSGIKKPVALCPSRPGSERQPSPSLSPLPSPSSITTTTENRSSRKGTPAKTRSDNKLYVITLLEEQAIEATQKRIADNNARNPAQTIYDSNSNYDPTYDEASILASMKVTQLKQ